MKAQIKTTWNRSVAQRSIEPLGEAVIAVFYREKSTALDQSESRIRTYRFI